MKLAAAADVTAAQALLGDAEQDFRAAFDADPQGVFADNARYYVGRVLYEQGRYADAVTALASFEDDFPSSTYLDNARYYRGRALYAQGLYAEAIAVFELVRADTASFYADRATYYVARSHYETAKLSGLTTDYEAARAVFESLLATYPSSNYVDNTLYYLGRIDYAEGLYADAVARFESVLAAAPTPFEDNAQYFLGLSHYRMGQLVTARSDLVSLQTTYPSSLYVDNAYYWIVVIDVDRGDCASAQQTLNDLVAYDPTSNEIALAQSYMQGGGC